MRGLLKGLLWITGILAVLAGLGRLFLFKVWTIPDDPALNASLAPTLAAGDVVIVLTKGERGFGDLVRCGDPEDAQRWVVGRISGKEGDQVRVDDRGVLTLNGRRYDTTESCAPGDYTVAHPVSGHTMKLQCGRVEMADSWHMKAIGEKGVEPYEHKVGPGRVFLLADDRSYHDDSRDFGAVPAESCTEQLVFRLWSKEGWSDTKHRMEGIR